MKSKENVTDEDISEMIDEYKSLHLTSKSKKNEIIYKGNINNYHIILSACSVFSFYLNLDFIAMLQQ